MHYRIINYKYMSVATETPFDLLQKRDKERRLMLKQNIYDRDPKHRAISYNFKRGISEQ